MTKRKRSKTEVPKLKELKDEQIQAIMDLMDALRAEGVDKEVDIPVTVVVGDTSSGKSSVMSRLTGLKFPCGEEVTTSFVTEVDMRSSDEDSVTLTVLSPEVDRSGKVKEGGKLCREEIESESIDQAVIDAFDLMKARSNQKLMRDILHIEIRGPECPSLTVIDLPGLMQAQIDGFSKADMDLTAELVESYIQSPHTIILTIISASNNIVNQKITQMTREVDPQGDRTMGILTKVDTVTGTASDRQMLDTLSNQKIAFKLGWHALVNTIDGNERATDVEINEAEKKFFKTPRFSKFNKRDTGIDALRKRVVKIAGRKLVQALPDVKRDVQINLQYATDTLAALGDPRTATKDQQKFLTKLAKAFEEMIKVEVDAPKSDVSAVKEALQQNLRTELSKLQSDFAQAMRHRATSSRFDTNPNVVDYMSELNVYNNWKSPGKVTTLNNAIAWVSNEQAACGTSVFPGMIDIVVPAKLLQELSKQWEHFTNQHILFISAKCEQGLNRILGRCTKKDLVKNIVTSWVKPLLQEETERAKETVECLSETRLTSFASEKKRLDDLRDIYWRTHIAQLNATTPGRPWQPTNIEQSMALNTLCGIRASYDVQLDYWITAVGKEIVESFLRRLPEVLTKDRVKAASNAEIKKLVSEPKKTLDERQELERKVAMLKGALEKIDKLQGNLRAS